MRIVNSVRDTSEVGEVRRAAAGLARRSDLAEDLVGRLALVATEMATNLLKHGGGGFVVVDRFHDADGSGLELLALDKGPGMADVDRCLVDGFSTAGSPGTGLGAITRNCDRYAIYSRAGLGTAVLARFVTGHAVSVRGPEVGGRY
jgi:anti-sigma regulatory factor (Ser/Thr protein kinase)